MITKNRTKKRNLWQYVIIIPLVAALFFYAACETNPAQNVKNDPTPENVEVFDAVDVMPEYPGGFVEVRKYIAQNIRYPQGAQETGTSGKVYVKFVVNEQGKVVNPQILRYDINQKETINMGNEHQIVVISYNSDNENPLEKDKNVILLEEEALRVVSGIPDFTSPGYKDGKRVSVFFTLPIEFKLQ